MTYDELQDLSGLSKAGRWIGIVTAVISLMGWAGVAVANFVAPSGNSEALLAALLGVAIAPIAFQGSVRRRPWWLLMAGSCAFVATPALKGVSEPLSFVGYLAIGYLVAAMLMWRPGAVDIG